MICRLIPRFKSNSSARRTYRTSLKEKYYLPKANNELQIAKRPLFFSQSEFKDLLEYWNCEKVQELSKTNKKKRKKLRYPHMVGKSSFAIICEGKKKESYVAMTNKNIFVATRKRKSDRVYKDSYEETSSKIAEIV